MTAHCGRQQAFGVPLEEVGNSKLLYCMSVQGNREGKGKGKGGGGEGGGGEGREREGRGRGGKGGGGEGREGEGGSVVHVHVPF